MTSQALLAVNRALLDMLAAICDGLPDVHAPFKDAAAFYFRHGTPGRVPAPFDAAALDAFKDAFEQKLKQKKLGLAAFIDAGVLDLLREPEAFEAGDGPLHPPPADAAPAAAAVVVPMFVLGKTKGYGKSTTLGARYYRKRMCTVYTDAAFRSLLIEQHVRLPEVLSPERHHATLQLPVVYAADVAMQLAGRYAASTPVAIWNCVVVNLEVKHINVEVHTERSNGCDVAIVTIRFEHDDSTMQLMFVREMPTVLEDWRRTPQPPRVPLRLRHLAPMQVLGKTDPATNHRAFTAANMPLTPVAVSLAHAGAPADAAAQ